MLGGGLNDSLRLMWRSAAITQRHELRRQNNLLRDRSHSDSPAYALPWHAGRRTESLNQETWSVMIPAWNQYFYFNKIMKIWKYWYSDRTAGVRGRGLLR